MLLISLTPLLLSNHVSDLQGWLAPVNLVLVVLQEIATRWQFSAQSQPAKQRSFCILIFHVCPFSDSQRKALQRFDPVSCFVHRFVHMIV